MNIIEKVFEEMSTDADGNDKQAEILKEEYMKATEDQQKAIDRVFIALCGWSLRTLLVTVHLFMRVRRRDACILGAGQG
jgi:hypothetical protein